jgi:hypothetical protein
VPATAAVLQSTTASTWDAQLVGPGSVDYVLLSAAAELRTYVARDEAGNTLTFQVKVRKSATALQAFVVTTRANNGAAVTAGANLLQATWWVDRGGTETITVWVTVGAVGADQQQIEGAFTNSTNQTVQTTFVAVASRTGWGLVRGTSVSVAGYAPPRLVAADGARLTIER